MFVSRFSVILEDVAPDDFEARANEYQVVGLLLLHLTQAAPRVRVSVIFPIAIPEIVEAGDEPHRAAIRLLAGAEELSWTS